MGIYEMEVVNYSLQVRGNTKRLSKITIDKHVRPFKWIKKAITLSRVLCVNDEEEDVLSTELIDELIENGTFLFNKNVQNSRLSGKFFATIILVKEVRNHIFQSGP